MPQQSLNKILDQRITGAWICKNRVVGRLGHAYNGLKFKYTTVTIYHFIGHTLSQGLLSFSRCWQKVSSVVFQYRCLAPKPKHETGKEME